MISKRLLRFFRMIVFDTITSNPPYMIGQHGLKNPSETKAIARHEILCTFADITAAAKSF